jgi:hypothetical protein
MNKLSSVVVAITLAACGGGNKAPAAETTPATPTTAQAQPAAPASASGAIEVGELKFYSGDQVGMQLHANGHLEVAMTKNEAGKPAQTSWQDVAAIGTDGTISSPDGKKHGQIKPDGSFITEDGQTGPFHLEGETLVVADKKLTIDDKGMLQGAGESSLRIEGATTPGLRRTALVLVALVLAAGPEDAHAAPAQSSGGGGGGY